MVMDYAKAVHGTINLHQIDSYLDKLTAPMSSLNEWRDYLGLHIKINQMLTNAGQGMAPASQLRTILQAHTHEPIIASIIGDFFKANPGPPTAKFLTDLTAYMDIHMGFLISSNAITSCKPTAYSATAKESGATQTLAARLSALESRLNNKVNKSHKQSPRVSTAPAHKLYSSYAWPPNIHGTYCWLHGYNLHTSANCLVMQDPDRICAKTGKAYTSQMQSANNPNDISGLTGNFKRN
jgi:hypothetical protein